MTDEEEALKAIGEQLREHLKNKKISLYKITKESKLSYDGLKKVLSPRSGYNIKSILTIMKIAGLHFEIKENTNENEKIN